MDCKSENGWKPTIEDLLGDPIVRAVMLADGVAEAELRALLKQIKGEMGIPDKQCVRTHKQ